MTTVFSTINAPFKETLSEEALSEIIRSGNMPQNYQPHIHVFFSEVHVSEMLRFCREQKLSRKQLKHYYQKHIKDLYPNPALEEALEYD